MLKIIYEDGTTVEEYENPPMIVGVEYRTTERFKDKVVYKRLTSGGIVECRLEGETEWKNYALMIGAAPGDWGYGGAMDYIVDESGTFETKLEAILATMVNHSVKQFSFYDTKGLIGKKFFGTLWRYTNQYAALEAINYDGNKAIKCMYGGVWNPWEWVNPPMTVGVEYRTTERFEGGMPVYCKLISYTNSSTIGSDSSVVETQIPHNISSFDALVRVIGRQGGVYPVPGITSSGNPYGISRVTSTNIYLRTVKNAFDSRTWFFAVYYTKK